MEDNAFVTLLLPPPLYPKSDTCYLINRTCERFGKIPFRYLTLPPPPTAPQNDTRYLVNRTSERFGKYAFFILPPPCIPRMTLFISYIEHHTTPSYMEKTFGTFKNNTVSEHFRKIRFHYLTPSLCTPKMMTVLEHFQKIRFRYLTPPSPLHPKMTLTISLWNIMKPNPFWNNNLLEPFRIILFRKVSERYAFVTHSLPLHPKNDDCFGTFLNDTLSLPYSPPPTHCIPKMTLASL